MRLKERYPHGAGVATYLARYVRGGPIAERRMEALDGAGVVFRYRDHRTGKAARVRLSREQMLRRVLWHVPEPGMHVVRYWGLYGNGARARRACAREQLGQLPEREPEAVAVEAVLERLGLGERLRCPKCRSMLIRVAAIARARAPP